MMGDTNLELTQDDFVDGFDSETPAEGKSGETGREADAEKAAALPETDNPPDDGTKGKTRDTNAQEAGEENGKPQSGKPETIRVKFLHEERDIPLDEARVLIQKGMNYDHILAERDAKFKREIDALDRFARLSGVTREQYVRYMEENAEQMALEREMETLRERHPEAAEETIREMARLKVRDNEAAAGEREQARKREQEERAQKPWLDFFRRFPGVKANDLPQEVLNDVASGMSPTEAWQKKVIREMEQNQKAQEQNERAKKKALGPMTTERQAEEDAFLSGFFGG